MDSVSGLAARVAARYDVSLAMVDNVFLWLTDQVVGGQEWVPTADPAVYLAVTLWVAARDRRERRPGVASIPARPRAGGIALGAGPAAGRLRAAGVTLLCGSGGADGACPCGGPS